MYPKTVMHLQYKACNKPLTGWRKKNINLDIWTRSHLPGQTLVRIKCCMDSYQPHKWRESQKAIKAWLLLLVFVMWPVFQVWGKLQQISVPTDWNILQIPVCRCYTDVVSKLMIYIHVLQWCWIWWWWWLCYQFFWLFLVLFLFLLCLFL